MSESILLLVKCDPHTSTVEQSTLEALTAAKEVKSITGGKLAIGLVGSSSSLVVADFGDAAIDQVVQMVDEACDSPRYVTDVAAAQVVAEKVSATIIISAATSRFNRIAAGLAGRMGGVVDTNVTTLLGDGELSVSRWYYRQRMTATLSRAQRPWIISISTGCFEASHISHNSPAVETVTLAMDSASVNTETLGVKASYSDSQTIRSEAEILLVAGAGWTKKQADGQIHAVEAEKLILEFVDTNQASLGSSKSLVDLGSEGQTILSCLTHLHQIGQTGSTPRHQKGLATCCHGEEPHAVGWRFINERRAINLDANCSWAQGKADVLYVADSFAVMQRVNELLAK